MFHAGPTSRKTSLAQPSVILSSWVGDQASPVGPGLSGVKLVLPVLSDELRWTFSVL
jgi:hypothetical protein